MAALQLAHSATPRPIRAFHVSLCSSGNRLDYTALARSSGDALADALALPQLVPPVAASVKPSEAMRRYRLKLALADLVE